MDNEKKTRERITSIDLALQSALKEQPAVAVNINAIAGGETNVLLLNTANTRYVIRGLRLKVADPGANYVTVRLYELVNGVLTESDSYPISGSLDPTGGTYTQYFSLLDMFNLSSLFGDSLRVTVQASAGGPYAVTGQYSWAKVP